MLSHLISFIPEIGLVGLAFLLLLLDMLDIQEDRIFWLCCIGLGTLFIVVLGLPLAYQAGSFASYRNTHDTWLWKLFFILVTFATTVLSRTYFEPTTNARGALQKPGAFLSLLLLCAAGMLVIVSSHDLLTFYLGLELATLPLYALSAFQFNDGPSVEAGSKFVIMGGFSSALLLFGISFLYGVSGGLGFDGLNPASHVQTLQPLFWCGIVFILAGIGFKLAMAPLHMWAPDVYEGAPTPIMAFLSVGSKAAAIAALVTLFFGPLDSIRPQLSGFFSIAAVGSMVIGNLGAIKQTNLRRFIAYSSIAQVGYMLLGMLGESEASRIALQYNLLTYGFTSFAFYFVISLACKNKLETISSLRGLHTRQRLLAVLVLLCMFSFAGIPPLAGFLGKFLLFSTIASKGHYTLLAVAVLNAVVSFYYYILIVKEVYVSDDALSKELKLSGELKVGSTKSASQIILLTPFQNFFVWIFILGLIVLGTCPVVFNWLSLRSGN